MLQLSHVIDKLEKKKKVQMDATMLKLNDINPGLVNVRTYACSHERKWKQMSAVNLKTRNRRKKNDKIFTACTGTETPLQLSIHVDFILSLCI